MEAKFAIFDNEMARVGGGSRTVANASSMGQSPLMALLSTNMLRVRLVFFALIPGGIKSAILARSPSIFRKQ